MRKLVLLISILLSGMSTLHAAEPNRLATTFAVEGTELARLSSLYNIFEQISQLRMEDGEVTVVGLGRPLIYINNRVLNELSELRHIYAGKVQTISIINTPGSQYEKNVQAVIIVTTRDDASEGFSLNNNLILNANQKFAVSDEMLLTYKDRHFNVDGFLAWNQTRHDIANQEFTKSYAIDTDRRYQLISGTRSNNDEDLNDKLLTIKMDATYRFNAKHSINFGHAYYRHFDKTVIAHNKIAEMLSIDDDDVNYSLPIQADSLPSTRTVTPITQNETHIDYLGQVAKWTLKGGFNGFAREMMETQGRITGEGGISLFDTDEGNDRLYANASHPLWMGNIAFGSEYNSHSMKLFKNNANNETETVDAQMMDNIIAGFLNVQQQFGPFSLAAGVRYEYNWFYYEALPSDMGLQLSQMEDFSFDRHSSHLYPNASLTIRLGQHTLSASYAESNKRPNMANIRVRIAPSMNIDNYYLSTEHIQTTTLAWQWSWMRFAASHRYFDSPIYNTPDGNVNFIGTNYHDMNFDLTLSPHFTLSRTSKGDPTYTYRPMLNVHFSKQWMQMEKPANMDKHDFNAPVLAIDWGNMFTFPHDWSARLNTQWHSRGFERNTRYYSTNFQMDCAVSKQILHGKLDIELSANNILHTSRRDITTYNLKKTREVKGSVLKFPTDVRLTLRYKL